MCKKFRLLQAVSLANFMLSYSIQCLSMFLIFCTNINYYIDEKAFTLANQAAKRQAAKLKDKTFVKEVILEDDLNQYLMDSAGENSSTLKYHPIQFEYIGFIIGSFYLGMFSHSFYQYWTKYSISTREQS